MCKPLSHLVDGIHGWMLHMHRRVDRYARSQRYVMVSLPNWLDPANVECGKFHWTSNCGVKACESFLQLVQNTVLYVWLKIAPRSVMSYVYCGVNRSKTGLCNIEVYCTVLYSTGQYNILYDPVEDVLYQLETSKFVYCKYPYSHVVNTM